MPASLRRPPPRGLAAGLLLLGLLSCPMPMGGGTAAQAQTAPGTNVPGPSAPAPSVPDQALQQAARSDGGSFRSEMWILRTWMEQGRTNDALNRIDELAKQRVLVGEVEVEGSRRHPGAARDRGAGHLPHPALGKQLGAGLEQLAPGLVAAGRVPVGRAVGGGR